jgi:hypothetical protein
VTSILLAAPRSTLTSTSYRGYSITSWSFVAFLFCSCLSHSSLPHQSRILQYLLLLCHHFHDDSLHSFFLQSHLRTTNSLHFHSRSLNEIRNPKVFIQLQLYVCLESHHSRRPTITLSPPYMFLWNTSALKAKPLHLTAFHSTRAISQNETTPRGTYFSPSAPGNINPEAVLLVIVPDRLHPMPPSCSIDSCNSLSARRLHHLPRRPR